MYAHLFETMHAPVETEAFLPILEVQKDPELSERFRVPDRRDMEHVFDILGCTGDQIFVNPHGFLSPFVYLYEFVLFDLPTLKPDVLRALRMDEQVRQFTERMDAYRTQQQYEQFFTLIDKRLLFSAYETLFEEIPDVQKYTIFRDLYQRSEYGFSSVDPAFLAQIFTYRQFSNDAAEERRTFDALYEGEWVTLYRGETERSTPSRYALSWTTDRTVAEFFATRFDSDGVIYRAEVKKTDVLDYLGTRGEKEVWVSPENLRNLCVV